jgi:Xaa-Pro aminopeptidase
MKSSVPGRCLSARLKALRERLQESKADALLVTDLKNVRYLTGFTGSSAHLLATGSEAVFFTDSRYTTQAASEVPRSFKHRTMEKGWMEEVVAEVSRLGVKTLAFEERRLSYGSFAKLKKNIGRVKLVPAADMVERGRLIKDSVEIGLIRRSIAVLDIGFKAAEKLVRPGVVERDVAMELELGFKRAGAEGASFDIIVASGLRSALPHGKASDKRIKSREFVIVDMGVLSDGYCSDETRTFFVGKASAEQKKIYRVVKDAHDLAMEKAGPGVKASDVDRAARDYIEKSGYGKFFGHGTGHGVGLDIHEAPAVNPRSAETLKEGMVFTIEPGVYVPGLGGVRIEDMALVTKNGVEKLTSASYVTVI